METDYSASRSLDEHRTALYEIARNERLTPGERVLKMTEYASQNYSLLREPLEKIMFETGCTDLLSNR